MKKIKVRKYKKQDETESGASRPMKGHLFTVWELKQDKSVAETSARTRASSNSKFSCSAHVHEWLWKYQEWLALN